MPYLGISRESGTCAICKKGFCAGDFVYHDPLKAIPHHLAHQKCYKDLYESRRGKELPKKSKKKSTGVKSVVELDPPF